VTAVPAYAVATAICVRGIREYPPKTEPPPKGRFATGDSAEVYVALPQSVTVIVGMAGSLVVKVTVPPSAPAAVGSMVNV